MIIFEIYLPTYLVNIIGILNVELNYKPKTTLNTFLTLKRFPFSGVLKSNIKSRFGHVQTYKTLYLKTLSFCQDVDIHLGTTLIGISVYCDRLPMVIKIENREF